MAERDQVPISEVYRFLSSYAVRNSVYPQNTFYRPHKNEITQKL